jgi:hypothetical protein
MHHGTTQFVDQANIVTCRYAESEGSNFDEDDDSDAEAPRELHSQPCFLFLI